MTTAQPLLQVFGVSKTFDVPRRIGAPPGKVHALVITSYSIHYTKLYESPFRNTSTPW